MKHKEKWADPPADKVYCRHCRHLYCALPHTVDSLCSVNTQLYQPCPWYSPGFMKRLRCADINKNNDCTDFEMKVPALSFIGKVLKRFKHDG